MRASKLKAHLAGQKAICFDPAATIEVPDLEGSVYNLSLRYGYFQRMVAATAARTQCKAIAVPILDALVS